MRVKVRVRVRVRVRLRLRARVGKVDGFEQGSHHLVLDADDLDHGATGLGHRVAQHRSKDLVRVRG